MQRFPSSDGVAHKDAKEASFEYAGPNQKIDKTDLGHAEIVASDQKKDHRDIGALESDEVLNTPPPTALVMPTARPVIAPMMTNAITTWTQNLCLFDNLWSGLHPFDFCFSMSVFSFDFAQGHILSVLRSCAGISGTGSEYDGCPTLEPDSRSCAYNGRCNFDSDFDISMDVLVLGWR